MAALKKLLRIVGIVFVVLLAFAGGALAVLTLTTTGRDSLAGLISTLASSPGANVKISGISGIWRNPLRIDQVLVEDGKGPWLAVRDVEIDWSRPSLLWSAFDAERIAAGRIELARLPEPAATPKTNTEPFSLPVSLNIKQIALPDIALGAELAGGRVASVAAKGNLVVSASPLTVRTSLAVARTDGTPGDLDASINFVPGQNLLDLDLRASESSGGILSTLLQLPGAPRVDILVSGTGAASDWRGTGTLAVDGKVVTSLAGTHRQTPEGRTITAKGDGDFASFVPERYRPLLGEKSEFDIAGTLAANGGGRIERATIESSALNVKASGSLPRPSTSPRRSRRSPPT
jgi:translocation and assembly module TamB